MSVLAGALVLGAVGGAWLALWATEERRRELPTVWRVAGVLAWAGLLVCLVLMALDDPSRAGT